MVVVSEPFFEEFLNYSGDVSAGLVDFFFEGGSEADRCC